MGGSQLKNLKATLKAHGLTGQTNIKKSKKKGKSPKEHDRDERQKTIAKIREQFNPFDVKANRNKREGVSDAKSSKIAVGKPGISKQVGEDQRALFYQAKKSNKNRAGGLLDKRFGEKNKNLSIEEVMLERFTKERQHQSSSRKSLFNLDDEDDAGDDVYGQKLTHYGKSLALEDDFDDGDLGLDDSESEMKLKRSNPSYNEETLGENTGEPFRKKTKAEVMQEVIAKSKYYKHERQKAQEKLEQDIDVLDDGFEDIMSELRTVPKKKVDQFASRDDKTAEYDLKVKELVLEKRAVPADRTKTEEEIRKEYEDKQKELEQKRIDRMKGIFDVEHLEGQDIEDLDEEFWAGSDSDQGEYGEYLDEISNSQEDIEFNEKDQKLTETKSKAKTVPSVPCPANHDELIKFLQDYPIEEHPFLIKRIIKTYQPRLADGNKEKLATFTGILLRHILFLSDEDYSASVSTVSTQQNALIETLKVLSEKFNQALSETCRDIIIEIQGRFKESQFYGLSPSDLVFFSIVGIIFSSSDHYHLVVTPCAILIGEFLEQIKFNSIQKLIFGSILVRIAIQYQRISKRYIPELTYFLQTSLHTLTTQKYNENGLNTEKISVPKSCSLEEADSSLQLHLLFDSELETNISVKTSLLANILNSVDWCLTNSWKETEALPEISLPFVHILETMIKTYDDNAKPKLILEKIKKFIKFQERVPLTLQQHKPMAIPSNTPKFEENFNPEKKSYDPNKTRSEMNKMKAQLKKERKFTMKEIRKDTRFEARQGIEEKKKEYADYHSKMARIFNQVSTEEGAEKNKYEREKKLHNSKK